MKKEHYARNLLNILSSFFKISIKYINNNLSSLLEKLKKIKFRNYNHKKKTVENLQLINSNVVGPIVRTFISGIGVILVFYSIPIINDHFKSHFLISKDFKNDSRKIMTYQLSGKGEPSLNEEKIEINEQDLLSDILSLNEVESDTVRLSAATIEQLFKDTNYNLNDIRKNKLVRPVALTWLPREIVKIENTKKRKDLFIQIILPLILQENNNIKLDRIKLFKIINKSKNTELEKKWLRKKYKQYGVNNKDISVLKMRMDVVPISMALAQAAKETGWGTSRFAQEGNALFGQWTWSGEGLKPKDADKDKGHKVMKFNILQASVRAYQRNLNTHKSYKNFRIARAELRDKNQTLDSLILSQHLDKYAETGQEYVNIIQKIIKQNNLKDFDDAKLLPSSKKLESLI